MFQITSERIVYKAGDQFVVECPGIDKVTNDDFESAWKTCAFKIPDADDMSKRKAELQADEIAYEVLEAGVMLINDYFGTPMIHKESWSPETDTQGEN